MPFKMQCPHCKRMLNVTEKAFGKTVPCPGCNQTISVPHAAPTPTATQAASIQPLPVAQPSQVVVPQPTSSETQPMLSGMPPIPRPNNGIDSLNQEGGSDAVSQVPLLWQSRRATKILALVASVFACVFVIVLAFGRRQEQQIVGKWERIDVNNTGERAEFLKDGSAIFYKSNMSMSGRWRFLDDGRFETRATILGVDRAQLHTVKFEFGGDIITLTSEDGTVERHMRVAAFSHDQVKMRLEKEDIRVAGKKVQSLRSINSMKLIGMALLSYRDARGFFPPAYTTDRNGKPLLSWRVLILPQLDQIALYQQFHLNEPWDSEHNMRLIARMPDEYKPQRNESLTGEGKCAYLTVRGEWTIFPGKKSIALNEITDGTSNTIMVVEVPDDRAVIWTRPDDFEYNEQDPLAGLIGPQEDGFLAIIGNGSVCSFPWSIKETTLKALFTRNRGETIDWNTIKR